MAIDSTLVMNQHECLARLRLCHRLRRLKRRRAEPSAVRRVTGLFAIVSSPIQLCAHHSRNAGTVNIEFTG